MEVIADYQDLCGECPVWDPETGTLYWTDNSGHRFYRYRPATGVHEVLDDKLEICGFRLNEGGGFTIINSGGIWLWDGAGAPRLLASEVDGARLKLNDCAADAAGRLLAGSNFYAPSGDYERGKLIRVDTDLRVTILDEGFELSNGIAFSLDSATLYFTDSTARRIYAYDYDLRTGAARNRRVLVAVPPDEGLPDGLTVDAQGYLWSAQWYGACVVRYDPDGTVERRIQTPAKQTSCATFGGKDLGDLYITTAAHSEPMLEMPPGYDAVNGSFGGALYRTRPGVRGLPAYRTRLA